MRQEPTTRQATPTWLDAFPGLSADVVATLRARRIRSVAGAVRIARQGVDRAEPIARAIPRMQLDAVLDREAAHLLLTLQFAGEGASPGVRRQRRRPIDC